MRLTPTKLRHEDRGWAVVVPWKAVTGLVPQQPVPVLLRNNQRPVVERTGPRSRAWSSVSRDGTTLLIDAQHLPGDSTLVSYVIAKAVTDPASRGQLGSPESLPPA